jgi:hypothetical protein
MMTSLDYRPLLLPSLEGWKMAGAGGFAIHDGIVESYGGPGLLWYGAQTFSDFVLSVEWRLTHNTDNSGVFVRIPSLADDLKAAIEGGYEIQIDDRGLDHATGRLDSPLHLTGAVYGFSPAIANASQPVGIWNEFEIAVQGTVIEVTLNDVPVARFEGARRRTAGHIALQAHHDGSAVQFRRVDIREL